MPIYRRIVQAGDPGTGGVSAGDLASAVALLQDKATAATDTELAAAVTTINNTLTGKQDSSTAATDAELAAAVATLQSSATAATDAELAAAVSTINTALGLKQDAATAATDAELATEATARAAETTRATAAEAANAANIATNTTAVATKQDAATAATDAELAAATVGLPGSEIAASILTTTYTVTGAFATIPSWQIVVPANSGTVEVGVPEGLLVNITTGTNAAGTTFTLVIKIVDEAAALVGVAQWALYSSAATNQNWNTMLSLMKSVPNNAAAKTYSVQARMLNVGSAGAGATIFAANAGFTNPTLRAVRR